MDNDLISAAVAGNGEALERLLFDRYDRVSAHLAARIPKRFRRVVDPEDILQQVFVEVFRDVGRLSPATEAAFDAWLKRVVENRLLDAMKSLRRKKRGGDAVMQTADPANASAVRLLEQLESEGLTASRQIVRDEAVRVMQQCLADLPQQYGQAIRLRYLDGLSEDEVAQRLGQTPDAIRGLCHRARKKLREAMGQTSLYF